MKLIHLILISNKRTGLALALLISVFAAEDLHATVFTVNTTSDSASDTGSLRYAVTNLAAGPNTIQFDIPTTDPGYNATTGAWTIQPATDLPNIAQQVTINGYTFAGAVYNTATPNARPQGDNAFLTIVINGSKYTVGDGQFTGNGLHFVAGSDGSVVKGLVINEWLLNGILIDGQFGSINGIQIVGNFIGTTVGGNAVDANRTGIGISGAVNTITNTVIGTPANEDRNIIAGSFGYTIFDGYYIRGGCITSAAGTGTLIQNNYIGTDTSGTVALGGSLAGVVFVVETNSTIGGLAANQRNIISGHAIYGVNLTNKLDLPSSYI